MPRRLAILSVFLVVFGFGACASGDSSRELGTEPGDSGVTPQANPTDLPTGRPSAKPERELVVSPDIYTACAEPTSTPLETAMAGVTVDVAVANGVLRLGARATEQAIDFAHRASVVVAAIAQAAASGSPPSGVDPVSPGGIVELSALALSLPPAFDRAVAFQDLVEHALYNGRGFNTDVIAGIVTGAAIDDAPTRTFIEAMDVVFRNSLHGSLSPRLQELERSAAHLADDPIATPPDLAWAADSARRNAIAANRHATALIAGFSKLYRAAAVAAAAHEYAIAGVYPSDPTPAIDPGDIAHLTRRARNAAVRAADAARSAVDRAEAHTRALLDSPGEEVDVLTAVQAQAAAERYAAESAVAAERLSVTFAEIASHAYLDDVLAERYADALVDLPVILHEYAIAAGHFAAAFPATSGSPWPSASAESDGLGALLSRASSAARAADTASRLATVAADALATVGGAFYGPPANNRQPEPYPDIEIEVTRRSAQDASTVAASLWATLGSAVSWRRNDACQVSQRAAVAAEIATVAAAAAQHQAHELGDHLSAARRAAGNSATVYRAAFGTRPW